MKDDMGDHACTGLACAKECCTEGPSTSPQTCAVFECPLASTMKDDMGDHACTGLACAKECCTEGPATSPQTCAVFECPLASTMKDDMGDHACTGLDCAEECCTEGPPQKCKRATMKKCMSSGQPVEVSNPESQVFMVPCKQGDAKQKWIQKGKSLISKASRECIAVNAMSSHVRQCYPLRLVRCNTSDLDQQWTSSGGLRDQALHYNVKYSIELSMDISSSSEVHACSRSNRTYLISSEKPKK